MKTIFALNVSGMMNDIMGILILFFFIILFISLNRKSGLGLLCQEVIYTDKRKKLINYLKEIGNPLIVSKSKNGFLITNEDLHTIFSERMKVDGFDKKEYELFDSFLTIEKEHSKLSKKPHNFILHDIWPETLEMAGQD